MDIQEQVSKLRDGLLQQRDEILVQLNLARMDAREEWEKAEAKLELLADKLETIGAEAKEASEDVLESAKLLGEEIKHAYERIRKLF
jgi:chromosome segregation ATPase